MVPLTVEPDWSERRSESEVAGSHIAPSAVFLLAAVVFALVLQGAFYRGPFLVFCVLIAAAAGLARWELHQDRTRVSFGRCPRISNVFTVPVLCGVVIVTTSISAVANHRMTESLPTILALIVATLSAWVVGVSRQSAKCFLLRGLVASGVGVAAIGFIGVVWHRKPLALVDGDLWRAASTLTYANATAAWLGLVLSSAIAFAGRATARMRDRIQVAVICGGLLLTGSRAGIAAAAAGVVTLGAVSGWRWLRSSLPSIVSGVALFFGAAISMPAERSIPALWRVAALVAGGFAALAILRFAMRNDATAGPDEQLRRTLPSARTSAMAIVGVAVLFIAAFALMMRDPALRSRFSISSPGRLDEWGAAIDRFRSSPIVGTGPGPISFELPGLPTRSVAYAHNEYLQFLAQQGVIGASILVIGLLGALRSLKRSFTRPSLFRISAIVGCGVLGFHAWFDYVLHLPAILVGAAMLMALAATYEDEEVNVKEFPASIPFPPR